MRNDPPPSSTDQNVHFRPCLKVSFLVHLDDYLKSNKSRNVSCIWTKILCSSLNAIVTLSKMKSPYNCMFSVYYQSGHLRKQRRMLQFKLNKFIENCWNKYRQYNTGCSVELPKRYFATLRTFSRNFANFWRIISDRCAITSFVIRYPNWKFSSWIIYCILAPTVTGLRILFPWRFSAE